MQKYLKRHISSMRISVFAIVLMAVFILVRNNLLPGDSMFTFHDETQASRVQEFAFNLRNGIIPPRMAPHYSFNMSYPVFNFYAPFSYWVTSFIHFFGFDIADSLKISFLLALVVGCISMVVYLRRRFGTFSSLFGALLYISSPWLAVEIFVRGNLGEMWFFALLPLCLYLFERNSDEKKPLIFVITAFAISFILTTHNVLSLTFLPLGLMYSFLIPHKKRNIAVIGMSLLMSSYFFIPAVFEVYMTYAREIASKTNYADHFLCVWQLWTTNIWGFGGSANGCENDGVSFMLGKFHLLVGGGATVLYLAGRIYTQVRIRLKLGLHNRHVYSIDRDKNIAVFVAVVTLMSMFMSTYASRPVWDIFKGSIGVFQFPWRFLILSVFGLAYFGAYFFDVLKLTSLRFLLAFVLIYTIFHNSTYFTGKLISKSKYAATYLSDHYIRTEAARKIPEYVSHAADYDSWSLFDPSIMSFISSLDSSKITIISDSVYSKKAKTSSKEIRINLLYYPYWKITINDKEVEPAEFDFIGRPILPLTSAESEITVEYRQTPLEMVSNYSTLLTVFVAVMIVVRREKSIFYQILR